MAVGKNLTAQLVDKLRDGVEDIFKSGRYAEYLTAMSKFPSYSARNCVLIMQQSPEATYVAGLKSWDKNFGRHVNKGETAIRILAPVTYKKEVKTVITDSNNVPVLDQEGNTVWKQEEREAVGYKVAYVFDISQTHGKELPELVHTLDGTIKNYETLKKAVESAAPCRVDYWALGANKANGFYRAKENQIVVKKGMPEAQTIKTLLHETAHARLHNPGGPAKEADRRTKEVQAESIAYVVSGRLGLDTSEYSFGYVAGWASGKEVKELMDSLEIIKSESDAIYQDVAKSLGLTETPEPRIAPAKAMHR